ncbi:hypothetical protein EJ07DRAFT_152695 [Lizonia empirigonia]|nr:hypothetical protein EJ07DRAFT_152695 [Lizonia empirigonia]
MSRSIVDSWQSNHAAGQRARLYRVSIQYLNPTAASEKPKRNIPGRIYTEVSSLAGSAEDVGATQGLEDEPRGDESVEDEDEEAGDQIRAEDLVDQGPEDDDDVEASQPEDAHALERQRTDVYPASICHDDAAEIPPQAGGERLNNVQQHTRLEEDDRQTVVRQTRPGTLTAGSSSHQQPLTQSNQMDKQRTTVAPQAEVPTALPAPSWERIMKAQSFRLRAQLYGALLRLIPAVRGQQG